MSAANKRLPKQWELIAAGAGSGALVSIIDFTKNPHDGTVVRLANGLGQLFFPGGAPPFTYPGPSLIAILFVVAGSLFVCWLFRLRDRADAFLRACSLLAAFGVVSPTTINPLSDATLVQGGTLQDRRKAGLTLVDAAYAQDARPYDEAAPAGTAYILLKHLREGGVLPESIVTVRNQGFYAPVAIFRTHSFRIPLIQTYGRQTMIQIDTPGYRTISFVLRVTEPVEAYVAEAPPSRLIAQIQGLAAPLEVELKVDEAEQLKEIGRSKLIGGNVEGAIVEYNESLRLAPADTETRHFLAYAYFRAGRHAEANELLTTLREQFPNSSLITLNLIKVRCALQDATVGGQLRSAAADWKADWAFDGEFKRVCGRYLE